MECQWGEENCFLSSSRAARQFVRGVCTRVAGYRVGYRILGYREAGHWILGYRGLGYRDVGH